MYMPGSLVVYGSHGVCNIVGTEMRRIDKKTVEYLVLEPVGNPSCKFLVPSKNEAAMAKLRPVLSREQLEQMLKPESLRRDVWVEEEDQRKLRYKDLISGNDISALISMVHYLHVHKLRQQEAGRKFHQSDENFLRDAQKLLETEFSLVLDMPDHEVEAYIKKLFE